MIVEQALLFERKTCVSNQPLLKGEFILKALERDNLILYACHWLFIQKCMCLINLTERKPKLVLLISSIFCLLSYFDGEQLTEQLNYAITRDCIVGII
jgi:hypothetical protein